MSSDGAGALWGTEMGEADNAACRDAVERLYHFLDGELTAERRQLIQRHLDECTDCIEAYEFEAELRIAISRGCKESVPETLRLRIAQAIAFESPGPLGFPPGGLPGSSSGLSGSL
jgi:mycothiol system anti-sigma-R factor